MLVSYAQHCCTGGCVCDPVGSVLSSSNTSAILSSDMTITPVVLGVHNVFSDES